MFFAGMFFFCSSEALFPWKHHPTWWDAESTWYSPTKQTASHFDAWPMGRCWSWFWDGLYSMAMQQDPIYWRYLPYIRPIFEAYVREHPHKIWPYMVQYLHFRILEFPLIYIHWFWDDLWAPLCARDLFASPGDLFPRACCISIYVLVQSLLPSWASETVGGLDLS